ncbi:MAG: NMT1/THI5 like protein [Syntrophaceae bacterium PtaU1.Bin231]|nr:MAG: NMT1/THI5 like protein [Syntrophaceae bacterium PtaU1.Bin231]
MIRMNSDRPGKPLTNGFRTGFGRVRLFFGDIIGLGPGAAIGAVIVTVLVIVVSAFLFFYLAPPRKLTITSGGQGSRFEKNAERYAEILARSGVKLTILPSEGSLQNLERLEDPSARVDIGFVQTGVAKGKKLDKLVSLGSISCQPLYLFYRSGKPVDLLSQLDGKRLAIGKEGTGTQVLALELLALNGIQPGEGTELIGMDDDEAEKALIEGKIDAAFMMGDSASSQIMRNLLRKPEIRLFDFAQADAYTRRIVYLNKLVLLQGTIDFGRNIPNRDIHLISPTVELVARADLHPALSDLLLEAAAEVHGRAGIFQRRGEFPTPLEHEFRISEDAQRYYKSGKSFLYRYLPFGIASFVNRIVVVFVPMILVLIPGLKIIPVLYRWRTRLRILKWYRALLLLETGMDGDLPPEKRQELIGRLDTIEQGVNHMRMPASFADQFYLLREHIAFVRERLLISGSRRATRPEAPGGAI